MSFGVKAPSPLKLLGDVNESEVWKNWKRKFVFYLKATKAMAEDGGVKELYYLRMLEIQH